MQIDIDFLVHYEYDYPPLLYTFTVTPYVSLTLYLRPYLALLTRLSLNLSE